MIFRHTRVSLGSNLYIGQAGKPDHTELARGRSHRTMHKSLYLRVVKDGDVIDVTVSVVLGEALRRKRILGHGFGGHWPCVAAKGEKVRHGMVHIRQVHVHLTEQTQ